MDAADAYWDDGLGWAPIGREGAAYRGDFDGNGHVIANLRIARGGTNEVGLGHTAVSGAIMDGLVSPNLADTDIKGLKATYAHHRDDH